MSEHRPQSPRGSLSRASLMVAAALLGLAVSTVPKAKAANLYFDNDATLVGNNSLTGAGLGGATATWGTASSWYDPNTGTNVTWSNSNNDIAYFYGGTAGGLSVSSPITIGGLVFQTTNYNVGGTGNTNKITFGAASNIILANVASAAIRGSLGGASDATVTLSGGIFGGQTAGTLSLSGTATSQTGYSGATVINNGMTMALSANSVGLQSTSGITLNNGGITLTNATTETALNRVSNTAPITSNGGTITFANTSGAGVYAETIGAVTLSSGLLNIVESINQASTGSQTLTLAGLSQAASSTGSVAFSALGGLSTTKNKIVVTGAPATTTGQIIGPWATVGTTAALQTDYAVYNASAQVMPAAIASVANDTTFTSTWAAGSNYNISGSYSSAAATTYNINTLRYSGTAAGTITMTGTQVLGTYGILNGVAFALTVGNTATTGTVTLPTTSAGNLYVNTGSNAITINANITDNTGALTLVKNGSAGTLTLAGTNTYTGGTIINGGTVSVAAVSGFGASGGITFNGSGTITATTTTTAFSNSRAITINNGALATYNIGNINGPTLSGAITGTGGLILQSSTATARTFTLSNTGNTFQGPLVIGGSSTSIITAAVASLADSASANGAIRLGNTTQLGTFQWSTAATGALTLNNRRFDLAGTTGGGAIDNSNATAANIITVNTDLSIQGVGNKTLTFQGSNTGLNTFAGKIYDGTSSVISLAKSGTGTWILSGTPTNTGAVSVTAGILGITGDSSGSTSSVAVTGSGTYKVYGAAGKASTGGITVFGGGVLTIDNTDVSGGPLANRLNSAVTLSGGQLKYNLGGSATAATDTITTLTVGGAGYSIAAPIITIAAATSGASSITVNSLARQAGGTLLISAPNLGTGAAGTGITNILVSANDASAEVIGGTGAAGSSTISINPFIISQDTALSGTDQYGFMTDKVNGSILANGLRSLVLATEYASTITSGASSTDNVNLSTLVAGLNDGTTVNSLRLVMAAGTFGTGTLTVTSGGILALGANRISGGTLAFGSNEALFHAIGDLTVDSAITGSGGLTKSGDGLLALSGSLSGLSGPVTIGGGRLVISSASSVSITGALTIANRSGAVLDLTGVSAATFSSLASPTTALLPVGGQILLGSSGTLTVGDANNTNFVGIISGNGSFAKQGSGVLTLAGANVYSGSTSIAATGTLQGGVNSFLPKTTTVTVNGTLNLNDYTLTLAGINGSGVVTNTSATARAITLGNDIGAVDSTFSGVFNATTAANLTITKQGGGVFTLTNSGTAGTATGPWTITAGTVKLDYSAAGSQTGNIVGAFAPTLAGGTLNVTGRDTATVTQGFGNVTLNAGGSKITVVAGGATGTTILSLGTLAPTTAGSTLLITAPTTSTTVKSTTTSITATATNGRIVFTGDGGATYGWANNAGTAATAISGTFTATTLTPGSSTISGTDANNTVLTSTGSSQVTALAGNWTTHTLKIDNTNGGSSNSLALGSNNLTLDASQGAILFHGNGTTIGSGPATTGDFTISGTGTVGSAIATNSDLIIHTFGSGRLLLNAPIAASTGSSTLTKAGNGTLVLGGTNLYTGATFITSGTLSVSSAANIGGTTAAITITDGAKLQVTAALSTGTHTYSLTGGNATIDVATPSATDVMTINGVISGAGGLTKSGIGILSITATPTYTGPTFVTAGTLRAGIGTSAFGVATPVDVSSGATLDINAQDQTIGSLSGAGTVTNSASTTKTLTIGGANLTTTFSGTFTNGTATTGSILTKVGTGILTLSGSTSGWTGGTNISGGVLRLGASNALNTTGTWYIANAAGPAQLELASSVTQTSATVTFYGTSANTTSQGSILIGSGAVLTLGGTLNVTNVGNALGAVISGSGSLALSASRTFDVRNSTSVSGYELTVAVPVTGAYTLTLVGSGNTLLAGNNSYAGLAVSNNLATGMTVLSGDNSSVTGTTILNSGILLLDYTTSNATKINPTGALSLLGGTLTLNGNGSSATSQAVASTTFASGSFATVNMNPGAGQSLVLDLKALTRAAGAGTVRFNLSGTQSLTNGVLTTATNDATTGLLGTGGGWATVTIGGATNFATASGGFITAITPTTLNDLSTLSTTSVNLTDSTGYTGTLGRDTTLNSIRFNASGASAITIPAGGLLRIDSGGILQTSGVGGTTTISGGRLVGNVGSELIFITDSLSQTLSVSSAFSGATVITKSGAGTLELNGINSSTGAMNIQRGTVTVSGGYAVGDTQNLNFTAQGDGGTFTLSSGTETVGNLTGGSNVLDSNGAQHGTSTITIGSGATLTVNQFTASLTYGGVFSGTGTLVKTGTGDLTFGGNSSTSFTGALLINQGRVRLAGNGDGTGRIGSLVISVNNPGSELRIDHDNNNSPDRIANTAVITLNNTAPGLGLYFTDTNNTASNSDTIGAVTLGAGHNVIAADYTGTTATRFGTLTLGGAAASVIVRTNNATTLVVGRNLGSANYGSVAIADNGGRIVITNAPTGVNAVVGGGGADGTTTGSIFPYMIGQATSGAPALTDVGNSFVRLSTSNRLRPLSTATGADAEYIFDAAGFNALAASTSSNVRFTVTPGATLTASGASPRTINSLVIDSTAAAVTVTGPAADTLALTSGAFLSTGTLANNTALTGFAGITTATNNEYIFFVTNNQFTLGSPLTTTAASLTKSGAGAMILNGLTTNAYTGGTYFNQGLIEASALTNLGPSGGLNFFGGGLRWATSTTFDISGRTVTVGTGGAVFDTNGNNITFTNAIGNSGAGGVTKNGSGNLTLKGVSSFTGASTVNAGRLILDGGANSLPAGAGVTLAGTASLQLGGANTADQTVTELVGVATNSVVGGNASVSTLTVNQGTNTSYLGFIGGAGTNENSIALVKQGPGTLTLGAVASTFTGGLTIQAGTVSAGNNDNTFGANGNVITLGHSSGSSDATLYVSPSNSRTLAQPIIVAAGSTGVLAIVSDYGATGVATFSGAVTVNNNLILSKPGVSTGNTNFTGGFSTSSGTGKNITIKNNGSPASGGLIVLSGSAVNNAGEIINNGYGTAGVTISADIGSSVTNLTQNSATSALVLSGANIAFTGALSVQAGSLTISGGATTAPAPTSLTVTNGATLSLANSTAQHFSAITGAITLGGTGTTTLALELGSTSAYDRLTTAGAGTASGNVRFSLSGLSGFGAGTYDLLTSGSGTLNGATYSLSSAPGGYTYTLNPTATQVQLVATAAATGDALYWRGSVNASWSALSGANTNWDLTSGSTSTAGFNPGSTNTVTFSNSNAAFTSGTTIATTLDSAYAINALNFTGAPTGVSIVTIASGVGGTASSLTITPSLSSAGISVGANAGAVTISAPVVLGAAQTWSVDGTGANGSALTISGAITGASDATLAINNGAGSGIISLSAAALANTYSGTTTISNGAILQGTVAANLSANSAMVVNGTGILRLNGISNAVPSLAGNGTVQNNHASTAATLTVGAANTTTTFSGVLQNGGVGTLGLTKLGTGELTLSGTNTNTGNITVNGGTLNISGSWTGNTTATTLIYGGTSTSPSVVNVSGNMTLFGHTGSNVTGGVGVYNQTAGTVDVTGNTTSATYIAGAAGSYGYFNLTGGTFKERNRFAFGTTSNLATPSRSVAYIAGTLDQTGGDWMLNYSNAQITVAQGGTIDRTGAANPFALMMNSTVTGGIYGVLNLAGGTVLTTTQPIRFGNNTTTGNGVNQTAIINLASGTLQVGTAMTISLPAAGANNAYLNFAGGTLKTSAAITDWIPASTGAITFTANVFGAINNSAVSGAPSFDGGLTFDTNGFDSSLLAVLRGPTGSGVTQSSLNVTGGTGYIGAPEVIFTGGTLASGGSPAAGYALISGGVVTGIVITSPGDYTVAPTITLTGGGGTGASVSVGTLEVNSAGGLTKTGAGTLTLSGANTYGGVTTISQGAVVLSSATATLGSTAAGTVVQSGAQLRLTATNFTLNEDLTLTGIGTSTSGAGNGALGMQVNSGVITYNGTITLDGGATLGTFNSGTATMTVVKGIAGTGDLTIRTGAANNGTANWFLQGKSNYSGNTIFSTSNAQGTVTIKNEIEDALPATSALSMNGTAGSGTSTVLTYVLNGFNQTVAGLSGSNGTTGSYTYQNTIVGGSATLSTLTVNNSADYSFGGTLGGAGANENNLALTKSGNGTLTLSGTNTYSGVTRVTGGTLAFSAAVNLGDASATNTLTLNGGSLSYTGAGNVPLNANQVATLGVSGGTLNVTQSTGSLTLTGGIASASTGSLAKTGPGMVIIPASTAWTAVIPAVTVSEGTLRAGFGTGGISALTVASAGYMDLTNSAAEVLTLGTTANALTLAGGARLAFELGAPSTGDRIIVGTGGSALTSGGTITLDFINLGGLGAGTYDLLSDASGSGLLTGGTTYALGIAPSGFNYTIIQTDSLISLSVVNFNPIYWRNGQGGNSWNDLGSGVANWTTDAAGTTDALAVPGTLDTVIFSATSAPLSGTTITTTLDNNFTIDGLQFNAVPSGVTAVTLNQGSTGTLTIAPSSTSSGISVDANAGNIVINAPLVASNANVASQTWSVDGTGANGSSLTVGGLLTISARIVKTGGGALTLSGGNSGAGGLTLNAGTLNINSNTALGTGTFTITPGATINNTLGSSVNLTGSNPAMSWNGSFTFTGSNALNLGAGAVILAGNATLTTSSGTLTVGGTISDASSTRSLTKAGAGTLAIGGNVTIGGNLDVSEGTATFGGTDNSIGGSVTVSGTDFTMNGGSTIGAGLSVTAGTATMNGANTITGSVAVTGGTLTLGGANDISGGVSVTTGTLNLNGTNTIASGVTLNSGSLNVGAAGALGANTFTIAGGTINNTSGSAVTLSNNNAQSWNGSFTFTGTHSLNMGNGAVTLGASPTLTVTASTLTVGGAIDDGAGTFNLTKTGAGTLTLGAANTYGGTTVINQGTVNLNATQNLSASTNGLTFGTAAGSTNVATLTLASGVDATFGGTFLVQTNSTSANTVTVPADQTLRLNGAVNIGYSSAANTTTSLTMTGGGTLTIGASGQPTNLGVSIGLNATSTFSNAVTLNLSGLDTFYANLGVGNFVVGDPTNDGGAAAAGSTLILAPASTIIATSITADSPDNPNAVQAIKLGSGTNVFNATTVTIGGSANRGAGTLTFNSASGTLKIRNLAGTGRATMNVQNGNTGTGSTPLGTVDLSGRGSDLLLGTLTIGGRSAGTSGGGTGTFTYDTAASDAPSGVGLDATTISLASRTGSTLTSGNVTGTLNIGANATIGTLTMATNSSSASTTGDATASVNISAGTITIGTVTMGLNSVSGATGNGSDTIATLAISGGTTTVSTAFSMGAQNSTLNAATTVNTATSTLNISAGSLILSGSVDLKMGSTTLDANNAATATINLSGTGLLRVGGNITSAVFAGSTVTNTLNLNGGTLDMDGGSLGATATPVAFNANSGTLMNAALINTTAGLTKTTTGTLILSGTTNGWTGDTVFAVGGGTIRLGSGTAIPNGTGKGNLVTTNGVVDLNGYSETINGLSGTGTVDNLAASTTSILTVGDLNAASTFSGTLQNTGTGSVLTLSKMGTGALTLATANTYTGGTNLTAGSILANNASALGTGTITVSSTGVRLVVGNGLTIANNVIIGANSAAAGRGIIEADSVGTSTLSGAVTINNNAAAGGHFAAPTAGTVLVLSGAITSSVPVVQRLGTVRYSGGGTGYTAFTNSADTTQIGANNGLATTATVTIGASGSGTLDLNGFNQSLAGIVKGGSAATIGNSSTTANSVLTITGTSSWAGIIQDVIGSGTMKTGLTVDGGELTLTSANTYTGGTTITAGTVRAGNASAFGSLAAQTLALNGGTLTSDGATARSFANNVTVGGNIALGAASTYTGVLTFNGTVGLGSAVRTLTVNSNVTLAGIVSDGGLTKAGNGTLTLSAVNSFTGATRISGGTLATSGDGRLATTSGITVDSSTTLSLGGNETINSLTNSGTVTIASGKTLTTGSSDYTLAGTVNGAGALTKAGNGALTITGDNAFSGGTTISAGTVRAGHNNAFGNLAAHALALNAGTLTSDGATARAFANNVTIGGNITLGATTTNTGVLTFNGTVGLGAAVRTLTVNSDVTLAGIVSDGGLIKLGNGILTLSGSNTFSLGTIITNGTITVGHASSLGSGSVNVGADGTLNLGGFTIGNTIVLAEGATLTGGQVSASTAPTTGTLAVELTGTQPLAKTDSGRLELTGPNSYTGATSVTGGGTIAVADFGNGLTASPLGVTALTDPDKLVIGGGATLEFTGATDVSTARSFTIAGSATIAATGTGALTFNSSSVLKLSGTAPALTLEAASATAVNYFKPTFEIGSPAIETLTIDGAGQWVIGGSANRFKNTATFSIAAGTTQGATLGFESGSLGYSADSAINIGNNAVLRWSADNDDDISGRLRIGTGHTAKLDIGGNDVVFASAPKNAAGAAITAGTIEKKGAGTLQVTFSSPNLEFNVPTGKLSVDGTVGNVNLTSSGTILGGGGTVGSVTTVAGSHLSPGNSPGTLNMASLTLAAGTIIDWQVQDALDFTGPELGFDTIHITGNLDVTAVTNSSQRIVIKVASLLGNGNGTTLGAPLNFNNADTPGMAPRTFDFMRVDGAISFYTGKSITDIFSFDLNDFVYTNGGSNNYGLWSVSSYDLGGDTYIRITAVPEPSTYGFALGALALAAAAIRRRRKNQPKV